MGLISSRLGVRNFTQEDPSSPLLPTSVLIESLGLGRSDAGVLVNSKQALRISTCQTCIRIISEDLGRVSHEIIQVLPDGSETRAVNHKYWKLIHDQPNPNMPAKIFWGALLACAVSNGNGYGWIKRDNGARIRYIVPLDPNRTHPFIDRETGELSYETTQTQTGEPRHLDPSEVLHIRGLTMDGIHGINPIEMCKNTFGVAIAAEKFGAMLFGQGARASGVLEYPGSLSPEAQDNLKKSLRERISGDNALSPLILEEGLSWKQISINPQDAQFLALRQFQKEEIAQLYRVPMHLLQSLIRSTNANIEHQGLDYVRYCLAPWAVAIEQEVNTKLLGPGFFMEHNLNDLMRGDFQSQSTGFQILRNIGVYSTDDIRRKLRDNPIGEEAGGNILTVQGAMIPLTALSDNGPFGRGGSEPAKATEDVPDASNPFNQQRIKFARLAVPYRTMMQDAVRRTINTGGDVKFAKRTFRAIIESMTQAILAIEYGSATLVPDDERLIEAVTDQLAETAGEWKNIRIADALAETAYAAIAKKLLSNTLEIGSVSDNTGVEALNGNL